jgi:16S rRNA (guanine527-N7)-methyltransferase
MEVIDYDPSLRATIFAPAFNRLDLYAQRLSSQGVEWGLIGPGEVERLWSRHLVNSLNPAALIPNDAQVIDLGSGAGLPGLPLAIWRPDLHLQLVEPMERRCRFLQQLVEALELGDRVEVRRARSEELPAGTAVVVVRALARLSKLVNLSGHLIGDGQLLAWKGEQAAQELVEAGPILRKRRLTGRLEQCQLDPALTATTVAVIQPIPPTAAR